MSSKMPRRPDKSLSFRIALLYAFIYILSSFLVFGGFYLIISSVLDAEIDEDMISDVKELELLLQKEGMASLIEEIRHEAQADGVENSFFRIFSLRGDLIASTSMKDWQGLTVDLGVIRELADAPGGDDPYRISSFRLDQKDFIIRTIYGTIGAEYILQIGLVLEENSLFLVFLRRTFLLLIFIIVLLSVFIAYVIARKALRGVDAVTTAAMEITEGGALDRRVEVSSGDDEIVRLANTFNKMLGHIQLLLNELKEINENIAHDLKTPITRIRGLAEVTLTSRSSTLEDFRNLGADTIEECDNLLGMINSMLYISQADTGTAVMKKEPLDLSETIRSACEIITPLAQEKGIFLRADIPDSCRFSGEPRQIQRMIANLLDNAIKFSRRDGCVGVLLKKTGNRIVLSVSDTGMGISKEELPLVFKRFYRCRGHEEIAGTGLGLSLVQAIVKQHGGTIHVDSIPEEGTEITIDLFLHR